MKYEIIRDYSRRTQFDFFRKYNNPRYSCSIELDITEIREFVRSRGWPLYANLCWLSTRAMNELEDFRLRIHQGEIVRYERINLSLVVPADDGGFSFAYLDYEQDMQAFNETAAFALGGPRGESDLTDDGRQDLVFYSALPDVQFTSLTHIAEDDPQHAVPKITFGKHFERHGRLLAPVGIQVNHIFIDGNHLGDYVKKFTDFCANPSRFV